MTTLTFRSATTSPYAVLAADKPSGAAVHSKRVLLSLSRIAEAKAKSAPVGAVVLSVLQESRHYTAATERTYTDLAARGVSVVLFAHGWSGLRQPQPGLYLAGLAADDSVRNEWDVLVCTPTSRSGFVSLDKQLGTADDMDRRFDWLTSSSPAALGRAAEALLIRVPTAPVRVPFLA